MSTPRRRRTDPPVSPGEWPSFALGDRLGGLEVVICCGSGGVGKTTVSAALGLSIAAAHDRRVLILTVDPARRLATALGIRIGAHPVVVPRDRLRKAGLPLRGEVSAAMLDMKREWDRLVERTAPDRRTADRILHNRFYERISDAFIGAHEYAAMEALYELHQAGEYDCVIVDTPPSRNALDFLEAPDRLTDYVGAKLLSWLAGPSGFGLRAANFAAGPFLRLADRLLGGEVLQEVSDFVRQLQSLYGNVQRRARDVYRLLRSPQVGFVVVTTLEPGPFHEAEFFAGKLRDYSMPLRAVVVNRMLPELLRDKDAANAAHTLVEDRTLPAWMRRRLEMPVSPETLRATGEAFLLLHGLAQRDERQLQRLERFSQAPVSRLPFFTDEVAELDGLARIAGLL